MSTSSAQILEKAQESAVVAIYDTHEKAEEAVRELQRSGFDMQKLSIVGKDYQTEEEVVGYDHRRPHEGVGQDGSLLGRIMGADVWVGVLPGTRHRTAARGRTARRMDCRGAGRRGGSRGLERVRRGPGQRRDSQRQHDRIRDSDQSRKFVVIAHGSPDEVSKTKGTLAVTKHQGMKEHSCCGYAMFMKTGE